MHVTLVMNGTETTEKYEQVTFIESITTAVCMHPSIIMEKVVRAIVIDTSVRACQIKNKKLQHSIIDFSHFLQCSLSLPLAKIQRVYYKFFLEEK